MVEKASDSSADVQAPTPLDYQPHSSLREVPDDPVRADCKGKRIGILIVAYNALTTLKPVLRRIPPPVWKNVEEVVIFDDASPDATFELAVGIKAVVDAPKLKVIKNPANLGYGGNQKAGYRYFIERGFDICVLLHGDGQYAPEFLAHMYAPLVDGKADAVFGSRMMKDFGGPLKGGMPLYKFAGNKILTGYENWRLGLNLTEFHSGYRAYNLHALKEIDFSRMTNDFHFDTEIIVKLQHQHFRIREVPIPTYYGGEICYVNGMKYAWNVFKSVRRYRRTIRSIVAAPEYGEYFVNYALKNSRYSSHDYAQRFTGRDKDVLEIGCGDGYLSERLQQAGNRVTGVDTLARPIHKDAMRQYVQADLETGLEACLAALECKQYDCILLLDILEHLKDPVLVLRWCRSLLKPNGKIVISAPNVANISVRLMLLFGKFNYSDRGILDRTHVHFYTRQTVRSLLKAAGLESVREKATIIPLEFLFDLAPGNPLMRAVRFVCAVLTRLFPGLLGYQVMHVALPGS